MAVMGKQHVCAGCGTPHAAAGCADEHATEIEVGESLPVGEVDLLAYLKVLCEDRKTIDDDERAAVEALRLLGTPWTKIAFKLDVPKTTLLRQYAYLGGADQNDAG